MQMEKTQQKKDNVLAEVIEKDESVEVDSDLTDSQSINVELELSKNVNKLMDRLEENDELKHILSDREQNKLISQRSLDLLRDRQAFQEAGFIPYEGTVENLLELAKNNDVIARAIEINPEKMIEQFEKINYRYALVKEHPNNHASLIHFEFGIPMPEIDEKIAVEKKRIEDFCKSEPRNRRERRSEKKRLKNKPEYDPKTMKTHKVNRHSLLGSSEVIAGFQNRSYKQSRYGDNAVYFRAKVYNSEDWGNFIAARFDKFGKIKLMNLAQFDKDQLNLSGFDVK